MDIKTLRSFRIFGIALFDLGVSMIIMVLVFLLIQSLLYPKLNKINFIVAAILLTVPIGIVVHLLFNVNTTLNYYLGLSNIPE